MSLGASTQRARLRGQRLSGKKMAAPGFLRGNQKRPKKGMMTHNNTQPAATQARSIVIHADRFQPFASRLGIDTVVRLRFDYDAVLVSRLKALLTVYTVGTQHKIVGGWLPKLKCWFIEPDIWAIVKMELLFLGHRVLERKS